MRKLRFVLLFLAAVVIVGLFPGSYLRGNSHRASSGGGGASTTSQDESPKIFCIVEQGVYLDLRPEVWENGKKLTPVDFIEEDVDENVLGYDVYLITPGASEIRFTSVEQTKTGQVKAGPKWWVQFYVGESFSPLNVTSACVVEIPSNVTEVMVTYSHL